MGFFSHIYVIGSLPSCSFLGLYVHVFPFLNCLSPSTGEAVTYTTQYLLTTSAGRRPRVPGAVVIVADRKSADNLTLPAINLRATGTLEQSNKQPPLQNLCHNILFLYSNWILQNNSFLFFTIRMLYL